MTVFQVELSDQAQDELEKTYISRSAFQGHEAAKLWYDAIRTSMVDGLQTMPERFVISEDGCKAYPGTTVRQMLFGRGSSTYRIYFFVIPETNEFTGVVRVLRVRHASMRPLSQKTDSPSGE